MKCFVIILLMIGGFFSCGSIDLCNRTEAKRVLNNFSREYTGLDTLIRTDGYYYHDSGTQLPRPFIFSKNGEFKIFRVAFTTHNQIQECFRDDKPVSRGKGFYTLSGDTITVRYAMPFQYDCYNIFSEQYLIVNDTTLIRLWDVCETCSNKDVDSTQMIYQFYKYPVEEK